ncbi:cytochrome b-c1 complex subunit 10 [Aspergillus aculeatinus CBS 121060]|uniref:Uncharacterized protein n=1 Tax=Aspergillus aculeatinus CBS 121060 TaxID=1448322 RepID=A0ACD1HLN2_9EURO|nr:hypothetical protein BO66DRAFT_147851 [Aspergillus aculeatinus CBS 121060]RAH74372.1 hypothetical protein BO66DRAFT_147851 [Aspergillus aculeatinus CBS 121060]
MVFSQTLRRAAAQNASGYRSPFGPKYSTPLHWHGLTTRGTIASGFGVSAGVFLLFFFGEVPRVRRDILQKVPFLDEYFDRTIAPEDNVCGILLSCTRTNANTQTSPSKLCP